NDGVCVWFSAAGAGLGLRDQVGWSESALLHGRGSHSFAKTAKGWGTPEESVLSTQYSVLSETGGAVGQGSGCAISRARGDRGTTECEERGARWRNRRLRQQRRPQLCGDTAAHRSATTACRRAEQDQSRDVLRLRSSLSRWLRSSRSLADR